MENSTRNPLAWILTLLGLLALSTTGCLEQPEGHEGTCYSPEQNLEHAYDDDAFGCACEAEEDVCASYLAEDLREHEVALICIDGYWEAVEDGPCMSRSGLGCYSPIQNLDIAYEEGASGCPCEDQEGLCATSLVEGERGHDVALLCIDGFWEAVEDGPCWEDAGI